MTINETAGFVSSLHEESVFQLCLRLCAEYREYLPFHILNMRPNTWHEGYDDDSDLIKLRNTMVGKIKEELLQWCRPGMSDSNPDLVTQMNDVAEFIENVSFHRFMAYQEYRSFLNLIVLKDIVCRLALRLSQENAYLNQFIQCINSYLQTIRGDPSPWLRRSQNMQNKPLSQAQLRELSRQESISAEAA